MTIKMLDCGETATTWYKNENQKFLDLLEETIYIQWELEPYYRDWKSHLATFGWADFSYHCCEFFRVTYHWDGKPVEISSIEYPVNLLEQ